MRIATRMPGRALNGLMDLVGTLHRATLLVATLVLVPAGAGAASPSYTWAHETIATTSPAAQRAFDEGLTYYYAYAPQDAVVRFLTAAKADPAAAMPHYGAALAYGPNINESYDLGNAAKARAELVLAHARAAQATPKERALLDALDLRYTPTTDAQVAHAELAYAEAMDTLASAYAKDATLQVLAADAWMDAQPWGYWENAKPLGHTLRIIALLDRALALDPQNIGANHFKIHALEESDHPGDALDAAGRLEAMTLAPACEHLVHMPAHVDVRTGRWDDAIRASDAALAHFRAYLASPHPSGHEGYRYHDTSMLLYAAIMSGDYAKALELAQRTERADPDGFAGARFAVYERYEKWSEIAAVPASVTGDLAESARGEAAAVLGHRAEAMRIAAHLADEVKKKPDDRFLQIERALVDARIAEAKHDEPAAVAALERGVAAQDAMGYMEPPHFPFPLRERLGETLLGIGRTDEAKRVFADDLARTPGNARSAAGLAAIAATPHPGLTPSLPASPEPAAASPEPSPSASPSPR